MILYYNYLQNPTPDRQAFLARGARNTYNKTIAQFKDAFNNRLKDKVLSCSNDEKSFWSTTKNISQNFCKSTFPPFRFWTTTLPLTRKERQTFAKMSASNSTLQPPPHLLPTTTPAVHKMNEFAFETKDVPILMFLYAKKSSGSDGTLAIVKKCVAELAPVLTLWRSYKQGIFPDA